jgi:hypothetical protein
MVIRLISVSDQLNLEEFHDGFFCTTPRKGKIQKKGDPGGFESDFEGVV